MKIIPIKEVENITGIKICFRTESKFNLVGLGLEIINIQKF